MNNRKQTLLKQHRRRKRVVLLLLLVVLACSAALAWWLPVVLALLVWVGHEAWFSDHLFYSARDDYRYDFESLGSSLPVTCDGGRLRLADGQALAPGHTLILQVTLASSGLGRLFDPYVVIKGVAQRDQQTFERGVRGVRYLNLTGLAGDLAGEGLVLEGRHCRIVGTPRLWAFEHPDYASRRTMVIAPHADDAELAAFGLYTRAPESWIVTLTAGEIEAEHYQAMGLEPAAAARLKGRLRAWDSLAVPQWGGVPVERCVQLGYFCLQLPQMRESPDTPVGSREADLDDTRLFRQLNTLSLPGDDGVPTWRNLIADLRAVLDQARPEVIVLPHPLLDPHPDHVCAHDAVREALAELDWAPEALLCYANHLHDNDRWPMGNTGDGISLPPLIEPCPHGVPLSLLLDTSEQQDKAMALGMMHDLQPRPPFKRRLRRWIQQCLAGRRWSAFGENEFFRKAVRRHELFWVQRLK